MDVACFAYCASAFWPNVEISVMTRLRPWIVMLHKRQSFSNGVTIPLPWPAFFGPPDAKQAEFKAEIVLNAAQFV